MQKKTTVPQGFVSGAWNFHRKKNRQMLERSGIPHPPTLLKHEFFCFQKKELIFRSIRGLEPKFGAVPFLFAVLSLTF
jgi:hypothetical protein